ncbi:uncharacterized protein LOC131598557 [Vicia villosa]|uniref:uncharacterized protein LOC131598557 n=1 Tax=Vicia villosa TaxID=3911 RepID=UPI00273C370C|nr:uncharacterized protein LOC131598557 [Vicia villosa]
MSFSMKKEFGIGNRVMKTITSFHNFEKDGVDLEEPREDTASLPSSRTMSFEEGEISSEITHHFRIFKEIYESLVGSLQNLTCTSRVILYANGVVSRCIEYPTITHPKAAKRILRYIKGTSNLGLYYRVSDDCKLCICHAIWLRNMLKELSLPQKMPTKIFVDHKPAITLAKNPIFHDQSKHIDTCYHYILECVSSNDVQLEYMKTHDQTIDIFTKPLKREDFVKLRYLLGVAKLSFREALNF